VDALVASLNDWNGEVRAAAASALRQLGWRPRTEGETARFEIALGNTRVAVFAGDAALDPLVSEIRDDTGFQRRAAVEALKDLSDPRRVGPLLQALKDNESSVRVSAIHALERELDEKVTSELLKRFRDQDAHVRLAAAQVISRRPGSVAAYFVPLLSDSSFEIRLVAVQFLTKNPDPECAPALILRLADTDSDVRQGAAAALGQIRFGPAIEELVVTLGDEEKTVRAAAEQALEQIYPEWAQTEDALRAAARLQDLLGVRPQWVRSAILQVLQKIGAVTPSES
jgi:HEAT repeat protein